MPSTGEVRIFVSHYGCHITGSIELKIGHSSRDKPRELGGEIIENQCLDVNGSMEVIFANERINRNALRQDCTDRSLRCRCVWARKNSLFFQSKSSHLCRTVSQLTSKDGRLPLLSLRLFSLPHESLRKTNFEFDSCPDPCRNWSCADDSIY